MSTSAETLGHLLASLPSRSFQGKKMFGEYAIYHDGKVVALLCDDRLYVKVLPETASLAADCELAPPYPGARPYYVVDEGMWSRPDFATLLAKVGKARSAPRTRLGRSSTTRSATKSRESKATRPRARPSGKSP